MKYSIEEMATKPAMRDRSKKHTMYTGDENNFTIKMDDSVLHTDQDMYNAFRHHRSATNPEIYTDAYIKKHVSNIIKTRLNYLYKNDIKFPSLNTPLKVTAIKAQLLDYDLSDGIGIACIVTDSEDSSVLVLMVVLGRWNYTPIYKKMETKFYDIRDFPIHTLAKPMRAGAEAELFAAAKPEDSLKGQRVRRALSKL